MSGKELKLTLETIKYLKENPTKIMHTNSKILRDLIKVQFPDVEVHLYKPSRTDIGTEFTLHDSKSIWFFKDDVGKMSETKFAFYESVENDKEVKK